MAYFQDFNDTNSAMGQPPTEAPNLKTNAIPKGGTDVGGTANLRADFRWIESGAKEKGSPKARTPWGVQAFGNEGRSV